MKKFIAIYVIICCMLVFCKYITSPDLPEENEDYIWVSAYPYSYFYWDEDLDNFVGVLRYNGQEFDCGVEFDSSEVDFFAINRLLGEGESARKTIYFSMPGTFGEDMLILKAENEEELNHNSPTLTFVRYDKKEYVKEHGSLKEFGK